MAQRILSDVHALEQVGYESQVHWVCEEHETLLCQLWRSEDAETTLPILALQCRPGDDPRPTMRLNLMRRAEAEELDPQITRCGYFWNLGPEVQVQWSMFDAEPSDVQPVDVTIIQLGELD